MTVKECYTQMNGNYEEVLGRLGNDERIRKYLEKFLKDPNFESLCSSLENKDYENGFVYVHNLKGVCCNLGIAGLQKSAGILCEELRGGCPAGDISDMLRQVEYDYAQTITAIQSL